MSFCISMPKYCMKSFQQLVESLEDISKRIIKDPIGSNQPEKIVKTIPFQPFNHQEQWHIIVTSTKNLKGLAGGRILLTLYPDDTRDFDGGIAWTTDSSGIRMIIAVWFYEDWHNNLIALQKIADVAHQMNIHNMDTASHLLTTFERKFAAKYDFQIDQSN